MQLFFHLFSILVLTSKSGFARIELNYEKQRIGGKRLMYETLVLFFQLMGVVSIIGFIAAMLAAVVMAIDGLGTHKNQPMFMGGEYRCYVKRTRTSYES